MQEKYVEQSVDDAIQLGVTRIGHGVRSIESEETIKKLKKKTLCWKYVQVQI